MWAAIAWYKGYEERQKMSVERQNLSNTAPKAMQGSFNGRSFAAHSEGLRGQNVRVDQAGSVALQQQDKNAIEGTKAIAVRECSRQESEASFCKLPDQLYSISTPESTPDFLSNLRSVVVSGWGSLPSSAAVAVPVAPDDGKDGTESDDCNRKAGLNADFANALKALKECEGKAVADDENNALAVVILDDCKKGTDHLGTAFTLVLKDCEDGAAVEEDDWRNFNEKQICLPRNGARRKGSEGLLFSMEMEEKKE